MALRLEDIDSYVEKFVSPKTTDVVFKPDPFRFTADDWKKVFAAGIANATGFPPDFVGPGLPPSSAHAAAAAQDKAKEDLLYKYKEHIAKMQAMFIEQAEMATAAPSVRRKRKPAANPEPAIVEIGGGRAIELE